MRSEALESSPFERFSVVRMGDGDEQAGPFLQGFAVQVHGAVFGDDPLDVGAGRDDAGAGLEGGDDLRG